MQQLLTNSIFILIWFDQKEFMFNFDLSFLNVFKKVEVFQGNLASISWVES